MCVLSCFSCVPLFVIPLTVACQTSLSMGFSRQEYQSGLPFPSPEDLPDPGIKRASLKSPALACGFFTTATTWDAQMFWIYWVKLKKNAIKINFARLIYFFSVATRIFIITHGTCFVAHTIY